MTPPWMVEGGGNGGKFQPSLRFLHGDDARGTPSLRFLHAPPSHGGAFLAFLHAPLSTTGYGEIENRADLLEATRP